MKHIKIDNNRLQSESASGFRAKKEGGFINVDCLNPSKDHSLKENYQDFSGVEQWELSPEKQKEKANAEIYKQLEQADKLCSSRTIREGFLALGYKGYNDCIQKAEDEAQLLRQQLLK